MFDTIAKGFRQARNRLAGLTELTESNIDSALREVRLSLIEADVELGVVKTFLARVKEKALGEVVRVRAKSKDGQTVNVSAADQFVKICHDELVEFMSAEGPAIVFAEKGEGPIRVQYIDGFEYIRTTSEKYDIVLVDLPDEREEEAQHNRLYGADFLRMCKALLRPGGVVVNQSGCQTMWRNTTLIRSWQRFNEVFETVAYYGSDEHEWAYLFGRADVVEDPTALMVERLATAGYEPESIDDLALVGNSIPPYRVRQSLA